MIWLAWWGILTAVVSTVAYLVGCERTAHAWNEEWQRRRLVERNHARRRPTLVWPMTEEQQEAARWN